jgi:hypothetical protein
VGKRAAKDMEYTERPHGESASTYVQVTRLAPTLRKVARRVRRGVWGNVSRVQEPTSRTDTNLKA